MLDWWNGLSLISQVFYVIAIPSTLILLLQTILLLFGLGGGDHDVDHDVDHDTDFDHDADHDAGAAHEAGLRLITVRGIIAFLAVCGWVGVAMTDLGVGAGVTTLVALVAGLAALILVAVILRFSMRLQQSGNLDMQNAVGLTGEVYVSIPEGGRGKVTLVIQERFMELDARCPERALQDGERVKVVAVTESNTLIVSPLA
ncbi:MAG: hypothetical protein HFJ79_08630 [Clostridiales bacterium]|jgi:hypothetical protein|nr:hypothetical protein [Clostridiales bacterium]